MRGSTSKPLRTVAWAATGGAWLFAIGTLFTLVFFITQGWPGDGRTTIANTTVDGTAYNAIGLTYSGLPGTVLLWSEAIVLLGAVVGSVLPAVRLRRVGHVLLVAWSALWLANGIWLTALSGERMLWILWPVIFGVFFGCTLYRAVRGWGRASPRQVVDRDVAAGEDDADAVEAVQ